MEEPLFKSTRNQIYISLGFLHTEWMWTSCDIDISMMIGNAMTSIYSQMH